MNTTSSINDIITEFAQSQDVSKKTQRQYKLVCEQLFRWATDNGLLTRKLTKVDIIKWKQYLMESKKERTIENYLIIIRKLYSYMNDMGYYKNITLGIKLPKRNSNSTNKRSLSITEAKMLLTSIDRSTVIGKRNYAIVLLMLSNALRTVEIVRLSIGDISQDSINILGKGKVDKESQRIDPHVYDAIEEYMLSAGVEYENNNPLFISFGPRNNGKRMVSASIGHLIKRLLRGINITEPGFTAHSLRHTSAVIALDSGMSIEDIRLLLRHENIKTTQIYLQTITSRIKSENKASIAIVRELLGNEKKEATAQNKKD